MSTKQHTIAVQSRSEFGKNAARRARHAGKIPAVVYSKGQVGRNLLIDAGDWSAVSRGAHLMTLVEDGRETSAIIKDIQYNYLKRRYEHVDFLEVDLNALIVSEVPVHVTGECADISQGGVVEQHVHMLHISSKPADIPELVHAEVGGLHIGDLVRASELKLPADVTLAVDPELVILSIAREAEEPAPEAAAETAAEPEVIAEKKVDAAEGEADAKKDAKK